MKLEACELHYHSGGSRGYYFTDDKVSVEVSQRGKERGVRGDIGPFLKVGELYLTKKQAVKLAQTILEEAEKMDGSA